ncbi:MAG: peptide/nickel transport system permease protein [Gaiellales bacterium]|jgi:peptide/nickel transport system permease protein|nr:peptide/nickel transport system permease protein [Gaiellales bacterium]
MIRYAVHRLALGIVVVVGVVVLTFVIARVIPGDPAVTYAGPRASKSQLEETRRRLGLDKPAPEQMADYVKGIASGDWGTSYRTKRPVLSDLRTALPASIELVTAGLLLALLIGLPLGLLSARYKGGGPDILIRTASVVGVSMPVFWLALILQLMFAQRLGWLPAAGQYDPDLYYTSPLTSYVNMPVVDALITGNLAVLKSAISHLILPALVVAAYPAGLLARMVRASALDTLGENHIRMVRALGFGDRAVLGRWALRPAMNPIVQVTALVFAYSLANTFLVEAVFDWPGLGSYAANSLQSLDTPGVIGVTLIVAVVYVVLNLAVDIAQAAIDPRIRLQ